ncbi:MAG: DUF4339 domain-containing protein [Pirellulales bacterium]
MSVEWYCRLMGAEMGPFTSSQLVQMARSHQLTPQDLVKKGTDGKWVDAYRVKRLFDEDTSSSIIMANLPPELKKTAPLEQAKDTPESQPHTVVWFYISDHNKVGPLSFAELSAHGEQGILKPTDRVWSSISPKWSEARKIKNLTFGYPDDEV